MDNENTFETRENTDVQPEDENIPSEAEERDYNAPARVKNTSVSDIIVLQSILCVLLSIGYMIVNMFFPQVSEDIFREYQANIRNDAEHSFAEKAAEFINSTPREYDRAAD